MPAGQRGGVLDRRVGRSQCLHERHVRIGVRWLVDARRSYPHNGRRAGFGLRRGTGTITAARATAEDARLFGMRVGDPLLVERRTIVDDDDRRIEATESRYPADRYALDVDFVVEGQGPRP